MSPFIRIRASRRTPLSAMVLMAVSLMACSRQDPDAPRADLGAAPTVAPESPEQAATTPRAAVPLAQTPDALLAGEAVAIAYSGYRAGQHPDRGAGERAPTRPQIREDLGLLTRDGNFGLIRLYDSGPLSETILEVIRADELPVKVMLGAWLKAERSSHETCEWLTEPIPEETLAQNRIDNAAEVDRAIALARRFEDIVVAVNVGNEALVTWNDHLVPVEALVAYAKRVKAAIAQPVTTSENYVALREHAATLSEALDFFAVHTYPVWEGKTIDEALAYTIANLQSVRDAAPGMRLVIGEAGWPSKASEFGARASEAHQKRYVEALSAWAKEMNITTFLFEAFDEDWKGDPGNPEGAEKHWGLFGIDRRPKEVVASLYPERVAHAGSVVTLHPDGEGWQMRRNGVPYRVHGVGGLWNLERAASLGANSIRTWGEDAWPEAFAAAERLGMTVLAGVWLSHDPKDFDDEAYLEKKRKEVDALARRYAQHPQLLAWSLGNEFHLEVNTPKAWRFVEELAQIIRRHDRHHPISTATAHSPPEVLDMIVAHAPSVDLLSVNSYAGLPAVTRDIGRSRFRGPFLITEWGPNGHWETGNTPWGRPLEQLGAEKSALYRERAAYMATLPACLGSYVFLWGQKQERTPTWYGMFVEDRPELGLRGEATGAVDVMEEVWTGRPPDNRAPLLESLTLNGKAAADFVVLEPGAPFEAVATASDPDGDPLTWVWELMEEPKILSKAGEPEARPPRVGVPLEIDNGHVRARAPAAGEYRLFVYALDGRGKVGTANIPFKIGH